MTAPPGFFPQIIVLPLKILVVCVSDKPFPAAFPEKSHSHAIGINFLIFFAYS